MRFLFDLVLLRKALNLLARRIVALFDCRTDFVFFIKVLRSDVGLVSINNNFRATSHQPPKDPTALNHATNTGTQVAHIPWQHQKQVGRAFA